MEFLRKQLEEERVRGDKLKKMSHNVLRDQRTFNEKLKEWNRLHDWTRLWVAQRWLTVRSSSTTTFIASTVENVEIIESTG